MTTSIDSLLQDAASVLEANGAAGYTVPTAGLYPHQWNWDAAFNALGWLKLDEARAFDELHRLMEGQWRGGMVPSIVFHDPSDDYFPGPEHWQIPQPLRLPATPRGTGITQPPVLATVLAEMHDQARDEALARNAVEKLYPRVLAWHRWWWRDRDPDGAGLVAALHPWETGRDNSVEWDAALARVPAATTINLHTARRDLDRVDGAERPLDTDYQRYIALVEEARGFGYRQEALLGGGAFAVFDIGINAILHRATCDLLRLADRYGTQEERDEILARLDLSERGLGSLWNEELGLFTSRDLRGGEPVDVATSAGFLPLFSRTASEAQAARMSAVLDEWATRCRFMVPSCDPGHEGFDARRYWRGPTWLMMNWMIADGLDYYGYGEQAARLRDDSRALVVHAGFREYYDPHTGDGLGGERFSWTAAIVLHWAGAARADGDSR